MNLLINISQIAIITGDNIYQNKRDFLINYWEKFDKNDYEKFKNITNFSKNTDEEIIEKITKKNKIDIKVELEKSITLDNTNDLDSLKKSILNKIDNISIEDKNKISKSLQNITNTNFGTKNENDITSIYENMTGLKIIKDDKYRKKNIIKTNDFNISIGGKIDGINFETNCIIEIKNRVNKLFYSLRSYEKVQIICYMYLFNSFKGHLVEAYKKKDNTQINIIEVDFDNDYMNIIIEKIFKFGIFFNNFIKDDNIKLKILNSNDEIDFN
jgi:hypothetical protein